METFSPRRHPSGDIAAHHDAVEPGQTPLVRALVGLALGAAAGTLIALATPPSGGPSMSRDPNSAWLTAG